MFWDTYMDAQVQYRIGQLTAQDFQDKILDQWADELTKAFKTILLKTCLPSFSEGYVAVPYKGDPAILADLYLASVSGWFSYQVPQQQTEQRFGPSPSLIDYLFIPVQTSPEETGLEQAEVTGREEMEAVANRPRNEVSGWLVDNKNG